MSHGNSYEVEEDNDQLQRAMHRSVNIADNAHTVIQSWMERNNDSNLVRLSQRAKQLSEVRLQYCVVLAMIGSTGEGKSRLLNSHMDCPGLAPSDDNGSACTSVPVEFRQKNSNHTAPFTIEIKQMSDTGKNDMIVELLNSFRADPELRELDKAKNAWSALHAAFKNQPGFSNEFLDAGALKDVTQQLLAWTRDLTSHWPNSTKKFHSAEDCSDAVANSMKSEFWPFIESIRVFLDSDLLKAGVVLVDLPGLKDVNFTRVRKTQQYLLHCHHAFITTGIARAKDTTAVGDAIDGLSEEGSNKTLCQQHVPYDMSGSSRLPIGLSIVRTKIDVINLAGTWRAYGKTPGGIKMQPYLGHESRMSEAHATGDAVFALKAQTDLKYSFIKPRNADVKTSLQKGYNNGGVPFEVHCTSSDMYEHQLNQPNEQLALVSGIPKLREFCRLMATKQRQAEATNHLNNNLRGLLGSMAIWAHHSSMDVFNAEGKGTINEQLANMADKL